MFVGGVRGGGVGGCKGVCGGKVGGICINSHFKLIKGWGCWGGEGVFRVCIFHHQKMHVYLIYELCVFTYEFNVAIPVIFNLAFSFR